MSDGVYVSIGNGHSVLVDAEDVGLVHAHTWTIHRKGYAETCIKNEGRWTTQRLHRMIVSAPKGVIVDHINHDTFDMRKVNLRCVTSSQNSQNRRGASSVSSTGIRNVYWFKGIQRFCVELQVDGKNKRFGTYKTLEEARVVADEIRHRYMPYSE